MPRTCAEGGMASISRSRSNGAFQGGSRNGLSSPPESRMFVFTAPILALRVRFLSAPAYANSADVAARPHCAACPATRFV
mgnify:CR=1 FL=1